MDCKWTIIFRAKGPFQKQRRKRFMCADNFDIAKATGLAKIGQAMYEGLYRWSDWDFAHAIEKVKLKLAFKRKVKEGLAMGLNNTEAYIRAREPRKKHNQPYMVDFGLE